MPHMHWFINLLLASTCSCVPIESEGSDINVSTGSVASLETTTALITNSSFETFQCLVTTTVLITSNLTTNIPTTGCYYLSCVYNASAATSSCTATATEIILSTTLTTTEPTSGSTVLPPPTSHPSFPTDLLGAAVGGSVGGVGALTLSVTLWRYYARKKRNMLKKQQNENEKAREQVKEKKSEKIVASGSSGEQVL